jgi:hypothetical protein
MAEEMGYQKRLYIGTAGAAASTLVTNATDIDYDQKNEKGSTSSRGDGNSVPIKTQNITQRAITITWKMNDDPADSVLTTILAAAKTGAALALKLVTGSGATRFDGDITIDKKESDPFEKESTFDFSAEPTKSAGRAPTLG